MGILYDHGLLRVSDNSRKKSQFCGIFGDKIAEKSVDFAGIFRANLAGKQSVKKWRILWLFSGQILQEIDWFYADQTSVFNVFLAEDIIILLFQQQYAIEMNQWQSL